MRASHEESALRRGKEQRCKKYVGFLPNFSYIKVNPKTRTLLFNDSFCIVSFLKKYINVHSKKVIKNKEEMVYYVLLIHCTDLTVKNNNKYKKDSVLYSINILYD